ncbi:MAG: tyrosine-type recombinase/integrase [Syntrophobacteraceae bacterium]|nr:tyrosine-type recombinase/integrase [Syntrophobacteraceae bacterium]
MCGLFFYLGQGYIHNRRLKEAYPGNPRKRCPRLPPRINESTATRWFKEFARAHGVDARLHDLRHTATTCMPACAIPLTMVQKIIGNADLPIKVWFRMVVVQGAPP